MQNVYLHSSNDSVLLIAKYLELFSEKLKSINFMNKKHNEREFLMSILI